jgi:poly(A) polymerase
VSLFKKVKALFTSSPRHHNMDTRGTRVNAAQFKLFPKKIAPNVVKIIKRLEQAGFEAYIVGGGVRDLLLNMPPKDYDIATSAHPEDVRRLFRNSRIIGRRFKLVHVFFHHEIIEVATFRAEHNNNIAESHSSEHGMILRDNVYGTLDDDIWRRDFTVNAIYYDITRNELIDVVQGLNDMSKKTLRIIGDPAERFREDPVRMIRALRFAAKLNFKLSSEIEKPLEELKYLLNNVSSSRLFEEVLKLFYTGHAEETHITLKKFEFFEILFPLYSTLSNDKKTLADHFFSLGCRNTDIRFADNRSVNPAFLFAVLLWHHYEQQLIAQLDNADNFQAAQFRASETILREQIKTIAIPKRLTSIMTEIWHMQVRFTYRDVKRAMSFFSHPRFRAAYDFLLLRKEAGEPISDLAEWWTTFQNVDDTARSAMFEKPKGKKKPRRKSRLPKTQ